MELKNSTTSLPPMTDDEYDTVLIGLRLGNAIWQAVYGTPLSERIVPEPLPISRCCQLGRTR